MTVPSKGRVRIVMFGHAEDVDEAFQIVREECRTYQVQKSVMDDGATRLSFKADLNLAPFRVED